jgi:hypothetical protein
MGDSRLNVVWTQLCLGGKTFAEIGFPEEWEYNVLTCCWEKDGFDSECDGVKTREKYILPKKVVYESIGKRPSG